jgi:hypothetical protein
MLIIVSDSSVRTFLLFINVFAWLFVFGRRQRVLVFSLSAHKLRAGPLLRYGVKPYRSSRPGSAGTDQVVFPAGWLSVFSFGLISLDSV